MECQYFDCKKKLKNKKIKFCEEHKELSSLLNLIKNLEPKIQIKDDKTEPSTNKHIKDEKNDYIANLEKRLTMLYNQISKVDSDLKREIDSKIRSNLTTLTMFSFILVAAITFLNSSIVASPIKSEAASIRLIDNTFLYGFLGFFVLLNSLDILKDKRSSKWMNILRKSKKWSFIWTILMFIQKYWLLILIAFIVLYRK